MHRTTRCISVTEAGERFYLQCVDILARIERAVEGAGGERQLHGQLRISAPPSFSTTVIAPHLQEFLKNHPELTFDLQVRSSLPDLVRERLDAAIVISDEPPNKQTRIPLAENPQVMCASASYVQSCGLPTTPDDLARHRCLMARFSQLAEGWPLRIGGDWVNYKPRVVVLCDDGEVLRRACLHGAGIALLYRFHVEQNLRGGDLVEVLPNYPAKPKQIFAVVPHREILPPHVKAYLDFMHAILGRTLPGESCIA